jgi:hypothetical protein
MPEVKLKGSVESLDSVPESHRSLYSKVGEVFVLGEVTLPDETGLLNTVKATRAERDAERAEAKKYKDAGVDLDEWAQYKSGKDTAAQELARKTGDFEAIKKTHQQQLDAKDAAIAATNQQLHSAVIVRDTQAALVAAGANELGMELLTPRLVGSQKMIDGQPRVVDATGTVRINTATGNPMTVGELAAEFKSNTVFAGAFAASGTGGTGSSPTATGGTPAGANAMKRDAFQKLSPAAQMAHIEKHGRGSVVD